VRGAGRNVRIAGDSDGKWGGAVPPGLDSRGDGFPALKRWAIARCASGAGLLPLVVAQRICVGGVAALFPDCRSYGSFRISNKVRFDHTNVTAGSPISAMPSVPEVLRNLMCLSFVPEDICAWGFLVSSGYKSCPPASKATRQNRRITKCSSNAPFHGDRGIECGPALVAYGYQMIPERTPVALPRHPWAIPKSDPIQLWLLLPATCRTP